MNRRWLLLPLAALLAAPLAWSAAAATFAVSPSVLQTLVVTDLPAPPEDPDDPDPGTVTITLRGLAINPGGNRAPGNDFETTLTVEAGATYRVAWTNLDRQLTCADFGVSTEDADEVGFGDEFFAESDIEHIVCFRSGGSGPAGQLLFREVDQPSSDEASPSTANSSAEDSSTPRSSSTAEAPPEATSEPVEDPPADEFEATEDAFDLPPDERPGVSQPTDEQHQEVAP